LKNIFYLSVLLGLLYSCIPHKKIVYLQKNKEHSDDTIPLFKFKYKIKPSDVLSVSVTSFNAQVTDFFNLKAATKLGGYLVSNTGYIHIPMLDSVYVKDLTILQIEELIKGKISEVAKDPYVLVNLVNFKFTALGEFGAKGIIQVSQNELTILEAIAMAGDITDFGDRAHVNLIRKVGDEEIFITLNLNNRDIMRSEYFYIQPNDVLYAEPLPVKALRTNVQQISIYLSLLSFVFSFYLTIKILK
jgi:polysaccharide export outer membrane protein